MVKGKGVAGLNRVYELFKGLKVSKAALLGAAGMGALGIYEALNSSPAEAKEKANIFDKAKTPEEEMAIINRMIDVHKMKGTGENVALAQVAKKVQGSKFFKAKFTPLEKGNDLAIVPKGGGAEMEGSLPSPSSEISASTPSSRPSVAELKAEYEATTRPSAEELKAEYEAEQPIDKFHARLTGSFDKQYSLDPGWQENVFKDPSPDDETPGFGDRFKSTLSEMEGYDTALEGLTKDLEKISAPAFQKLMDFLGEMLIGNNLEDEGEQGPSKMESAALILRNASQALAPSTLSIMLNDSPYLLNEIPLNRNLCYAYDQAKTPENFMEALNSSIKFLGDMKDYSASHKFATAVDLTIIPGFRPLKLAVRTLNVPMKALNVGSRLISPGGRATLATSKGLTLADTSSKWSKYIEKSPKLASALGATVGGALGDPGASEDPDASPWERVMGIGTWAAVGATLGYSQTEAFTKLITPVTREEFLGTKWYSLMRMKQGKRFDYPVPNPKWLGKFWLDFPGLTQTEIDPVRKSLVEIGIGEQDANKIFRILTDGLDAQEQRLAGHFMTKGWFATGLRSTLKEHKSTTLLRARGEVPKYEPRVYVERIGRLKKERPMAGLYGTDIADQLPTTKLIAYESATGTRYTEATGEQIRRYLAEKKANPGARLFKSKPIVETHAWPTATLATERRPLRAVELYKMAVNDGLDPKRVLEVFKRTQEVKKMVQAAGQKAVDEGLLQNAMYRANMDLYLPLMYREKLKKEFPSMALNTFKKIPAMDRLRLNRMVNRADRPPEFYELQRLIMEPAAPASMGYAEVIKDVEKSRLYRSLVNSSPMVSPRRTAAHTELIPKDMRRVSPDLELPYYGDLAGKWVTPALMNELKGVPKEIKYIERNIGAWLAPWKLGKTVFSLATHGRNVLGNVIMNDLGGLSPARIDIYSKAFKELLTKGKIWEEAGADLLGTDYVKADILQRMGPMTGRNIWALTVRAAGGFTGASTGYELTKGEEVPFGVQVGAMLAGGATGWQFGKYAKDLYKGEEQLFKLAKYIHNTRSLGLTREEAIKDALKWTFNYGEVSKGVRVLRSTTTPFITYTSKALPRIIETALHHPIRLTKYLVGFEAMQQNSLAKMNISEEDWESARAQLPDYLKKGSIVLMPYKDAEGRLVFADFTYTLPWGDISEAGRLGMAAKILQNPVATLLFDLGRNSNALNMPVWYEFDSPNVKLMKVMKHIGMTLMPSMTPGFGTNYDALHRAFQDETSAESEQRPYDVAAPTKGQALGTVVGFKTKAVNLGLEARKRRFLEKKQLGEAKSAFRRGEKSSEELAGDLQRIYKKEPKRTSPLGSIKSRLSERLFQ